MSFSKLKKIHVIIIGSVLCVIAGVALFFLQVKPQMNAYNEAKASYDIHVVKGNETYRAAAIVKRDQARNSLQIAQAELDIQMKRCMPNLNFARRDIGMLALWKEQIKTLGPLLESFARDKTVRTSGLSIQIPAPPANPNDAVFDSQDMLQFPLGSITVTGDFKSLMTNVRRWNNCRRLVLVGIPSLSGVSPRLTQTYSLTCFVFPVAKADPRFKEPMAPGALAAAAPGAAPGPAPAPVAH